MNHREGHFLCGHKAILKQKAHDHQLIDRYQTIQALIATHETCPNPDIVYIKHLQRRRDVLYKQIVYCGLL